MKLIFSGNERSKMLRTTVLAAAFSLAAGVAYAQAPAGDGSAFNATNPYHWTRKHPGEVPPLNLVQAARAWNAAHHSVSVANVTNPGGELLSYNGGSVMDSKVKVYLVFYGSQWGTKSTDAKGDSAFSNDPYSAASAAQEFFKGIGTGNELWSADLTQYCDSSATTAVSNGATSCPNGASFIPYQSGGVLAGVWYDNSAASPSAATALQLGQEADAAAAHFGNTSAASNRYTYYVILSPTGTNPDNYNGAYCAWHDSNADAGTSQPYGELAFSNQPYNMDSGNCGNNFVNSGAAGNLDGYTMTLGHEWQEMMTDTYPENLAWYNANWVDPNSGQQGAEIGDECAWISPGQDGGAGNVAFGTGTFAMQSSWSNDSNDCVLSHQILQHGGGGVPSANFSSTTSGLTANFTDASTDNGGSISTHSWTFGDGGTSTATNPSHTYTTAGTYSVTETVTDSVNAKTSSKTSTVTVSSAAVAVNIVAANSGLCLNVVGNASDAGVIQSPCAATGNELWTLVPVGSYYHIVAKGSGLCLNVPGYSTAQGTQLIQWPCQGNTNTNDQWSLVAIGNRHHIVSRSSGLCVNIDGNSGSSGATVIQWACQSTATLNDQFTF